MLNKTIRMELLSDLCPASGDGFAGYVDTDVCFDDSGLPYIPAKRLKGVLRECGLDILSVDESFLPIFSELFGETGKFIPGTLHIGNGKLENYAEIVGSLGTAKRSELAEVYTSVRTRTKMENGKAAKGTLRTSRVLNKRQVYSFPISLPEGSEDFFEMCVKLLRHMGLNRSRGLGEVKCTLISAATSSGNKFVVKNSGTASHVSFTLELTEPVISAGRSGKSQDTESYIFGSAILGAFAGKYMERFDLKWEEAHKDADFRRIFLEGGVAFTAAMPCVHGETYYPAPFTLKTDKLKTRLFDETKGVFDDNGDRPICRRLGGFILTDADGGVQTYLPAKTAFSHHARPSDRGVGHATENDGEFYTYEALSEGQTFAASAIGSAEDVGVLAGLFADGATIRIGRSRTAQYGKVKIAPTDKIYTPNSFGLKNGDTFRLVAVTPIILEDLNGINRADVTLICDCLGADFELIRSVCAETTISGYYGKWLLPKRQERAVAEGSTVVFRYNGEGTTLTLDFIGKRAGEGFGQVRFEKIPEPTAFSLAPESGIAEQIDGDCLPEIKRLRDSKLAVAKGIEYAQTKYVIAKDKDTAPKNSNLARILAALAKSENYCCFAKRLDGIKQPKQKIAALAFATGKEKQHFQTDARHLEPDQIAELLLEQHKCEYSIYRKYLSAAAQRIRQKRRNKTETARSVSAE
jgi:CRISPR-associated protein Csx10